MTPLSRRDLLLDIGRGMFVAGLGAGLTADLGLGSARADDDTARLTFGDLEPLVEFVRSTAPDKLLPAAVDKLNAGTDLKKLVAAAALANARAFGGEDYVGFHTLMALAPAYHIAAEEPDATKRPLAVLKVLFRNATRLSETHGDTKETLKPVMAADRGTPDDLRQAARKGDAAAAERTFGSFWKGTPTDALDSLMEVVDDATEVHRVVLVSRSWDLIDFVGRENAQTLLRQSVRFCVKADQNKNYLSAHAPAREVLPKLLDQYKLAGMKLGKKAADDTWVEHLCEAIFSGSPSAAADAAAAALSEGFAADAVGQAIALAANQLVLRDEGRPKGQAQANKPVGSCHGDSIGVHACDSANAWRSLARIGGHRTVVSSLILGAFQVATDRTNRGGDFLKWQPYPRDEHSEKVRDVAGDKLLGELDAAIRANDQGRAAALTARLGSEMQPDAKAVFALLRKYAISEDGALHAEKFYRTVTEEFAGSRPTFRWRQLVALARVTASAYGQPAPGYTDAARLLGA